MLFTVKTATATITSALVSAANGIIDAKAPITETCRAMLSTKAGNAKLAAAVLPLCARPEQRSSKQRKAHLATLKGKAKAEFESDRTKNGKVYAVIVATLSGIRDMDGADRGWGVFTKDAPQDKETKVLTGPPTIKPSEKGSAGSKGRVEYTDHAGKWTPTRARIAVEEIAASMSIEFLGKLIGDITEAELYRIFQTTYDSRVADAANSKKVASLAKARKAKAAKVKATKKAKAKKAA